jgi:hypothetical protein
MLSILLGLEFRFLIYKSEADLEISVYNAVNSAQAILLPIDECDAQAKK